MSAIPKLLADAVTAVLIAAVTAESFESLTAEDTQALTARPIRRSYPDWDDDFKDLGDGDLSIDVVFVSSAASGGELVELDTEATLNSDPAVDVVVRHRFSPTDRESTGRLKNAPVDKLVHLVQELYEKLAALRDTPLTLSAVLPANWQDSSVRTYCDYGRLRQGLFLGVARVRYNVSKAVG